MRFKTDSLIHDYLQQARQIKPRIITEADLAPLPDPVQRYLHYTGVIGKPQVRCARVVQSGVLRTAPSQNWMPIQAVQYSTLAGSFSRTWYAAAKKGPVALLKARDRYDNGAGHMLIKLFSLFTVADVRGPEIDISALLIFFNDMVMWPTAFLDKSLTWEAIDANSARATLRLFNRQASAILHFNACAELINFVTEERYRSVGKDQLRTKWSTPLRNYREVNGFRIPTEGEAIWHLPEDDFCYIQIKLDEVLYDTFMERN
jgi:hypothetical protein